MRIKCVFGHAKCVVLVCCERAITFVPEIIWRVTFTVLCILLAMLSIWFFKNAFALPAKIVFTLLIKCYTRITKSKEKNTNYQTPKS